MIYATFEKNQNGEIVAFKEEGMQDTLHIVKTLSVLLFQRWSLERLMDCRNLLMQRLMRL